MIELVTYTDAAGDVPFRAWLHALQDRQARTEFMDMTHGIFFGIGIELLIT